MKKIIALLLALVMMLLLCACGEIELGVPDETINLYMRDYANSWQASHQIDSKAQTDEVAISYIAEDEIGVITYTNTLFYQYDRTSKMWSLVRAGEWAEYADYSKGYDMALTFMAQGEYISAINVFKALNGYKDSSAQITKCEIALSEAAILEIYNKAVRLIESGEFIEAYETLESLNGFKDSAQLQEEIFSAYEAMIQLKNIKIGDILYFGSYEQDNDFTNGTEPIEWVVLDIQDNKAFVISKYGLDGNVFNTEEVSVTWETCTLRTWLNDVFFNSAFSPAEQTLIAESLVTADKNPKYGTPPGNDTIDRVFLLSVLEAEKYYHTNQKRVCTPTAYAVANGTFALNEKGDCRWWLRTPGGNWPGSCAVVNNRGVIEYYGIRNVSPGGAVRPVMWVTLG